MDLCTRKYIDSWSTALKWVLGHAYALAGEPTKGASLLEQAISEAAADKKMCCQSLRMAWLAEAELIGGNTARAEQLCQEALSLAKLYQERGLEAHIYRVLGDIATVHAADDAVPISMYEQALSIANQLSMRPIEARCHLAIGQLLSKRNGPGNAQAALAKAAAMFASMGTPDMTPSRPLAKRISQTTEVLAASKP